MPDNLSKAQRSYCMSRVKSRDTAPEKTVCRLLHKEGLRFRQHVATLPGRPDIVFAAQRLAVFIDGDFWHGYRFPTWSSSLSEFWRTKIEGNRRRDARNFRRLRSAGWRVLRVWQHQIDANPELCAQRIKSVLRERRRVTYWPLALNNGSRRSVRSGQCASK